jgi:putative endopeptidase
MNLTLRMLCRKAAAFALFTLVPLAAFSQEGSTPETLGIVLANMDRSVKPGDDFYRYACGDWIKRTEIPPDSSYVSIGGYSYDDRSTELSRKQTAGLIEEALKANAPAGSNIRKIADFYRSFMDEAAIEAKGVAPLRPHLDAIAAIRNKHDLARGLGETLRADVDALNQAKFQTPNLFGLWTAPGFNDPDRYAAYLMQGGLDMPDREYYLSDSSEMVDIRSKYRTHVATMLRLAGFSDADARAAHIIELEHAIAEKHVPFAVEQDLHTANNTWKQTDFTSKAPGLDWTEYFRGAGLSQQASFIVWQPTAFTGESALVASVPLDTWKDWLAFHLIDTYAAVLPKGFADERFAFFGTALSGKREQPPRSQRGLSLISNPLDESGNSLLEGRGVLGQALGQMYARRYFSPETKAQVEAMVANIIAAFRRRIDALSWMDSATKAEAKAKLDTLYVGIGYPETWRDYSAYDVKADDIFGNLWRGGLFDYHRNVARLSRPVDRKEWVRTPQAVDAMQLTLHNALTFDAADFQLPFFDPQATAAMNYAAIGSTIGHELSHTFDIEGSEVDSKGRVRNWWKPTDMEHFKAITASLVAQHDAYKPLPDLALNGKQTLNENIANLGGLVAAYDAYHASLAGKTALVQNGFSGDQQFFLAFAQFYCSKSTDAYLRQIVMSDEHPPDEFAVYTVRNLDAWYAAFDVRPGDKLYLAPADRVRIW